MPENATKLDEAMMSLSGMIDALMTPATSFIDAEAGVQLTVERIGLEIPVQMQVMMDDAGNCQLGTTPPLYTVETSFPTVLHQVRCSFERIETNASDGTDI
jgi:hypothetical protein